MVLDALNSFAHCCCLLLPTHAYCAYCVPCLLLPTVPTLRISCQIESFLDSAQQKLLSTINESVARIDAANAALRQTQDEVEGANEEHAQAAAAARLFARTLMERMDSARLFVEGATFKLK
jgi:hypothetical protein